jgi:hypothetical protein
VLCPIPPILGRFGKYFGFDLRASLWRNARFFAAARTRSNALCALASGFLTDTSSGPRALTSRVQVSHLRRKPIEKRKSLLAELLREFELRPQ